MSHEFSRAELLIGKDGLNKLAQSHVAVFGIGGVGSHAVESLVRSGVGRLTLFDSDVVSITNLNRQIHALQTTVGMYKVDIMRDRVLAIHPACEVTVHRIFCTHENIQTLIPIDCDFIIDAIDTVSSKIAIAMAAHTSNIPLISCMGTGNKFDPTRFEVDDLYNTSICPLCKVMRRELKRRGLSSLKVVYSKETPKQPFPSDEPAPPGRRSIPGSLSFVPSVAGMILAGEVVRTILAS